MQATQTQPIDLEVLLKDLLRKDLPALHKHYDKTTTRSAHHEILHPQKNLTLSYNRIRIWKVPLPITYFSTLQLTATNNTHKIYDITHKHILKTQQQELHTKLKEENLPEDHFISHLIYLEKEKEINYEDLHKTSKYIHQLLRD